MTSNISFPLGDLWNLLQSVSFHYSILWHMSYFTDYLSVTMCVVQKCTVNTPFHFWIWVSDIPIGLCISDRWLRKLIRLLLARMRWRSKVEHSSRRRRMLPNAGHWRNCCSSAYAADWWKVEPVCDTMYCGVKYWLALLRKTNKAKIYKLEYDFGKIKKKGS